ncbi:MAG: CoA transferase [Acidimicrobiales bacterium]
MSPLEGVKVIEIDSWMAAPSAGAILADLGADVVKVEPLNGDPMRNMGRPAKVTGKLAGYDFGFDVANRGKRSISVALDTDEGAAVVRRLCADADVFMCNLLRPRQERFGLTPEALHQVNPRLVHATLTGYGTDGPEAWRPGYDVTAFFGRSGIYDMLREGDDGLVQMARPAQGDYTTGLSLVVAILSALRVAEKTGTGEAVETSLYETAVWTQATDFGVTAVDRAPVRRRTRTQQIGATANRFPCGDGKWIVLNEPRPESWGRLCRAMGLDDLAEDPRFDTIKKRFDNMELVISLLDQQFATRSRDAWGAIFDQHRIVWGPVLSLDEVANDAQAEAIGLFPEIEHPERGAYRSVRIPIRTSGGGVGPRGPAPTVGQHTREVLEEAGFDGAEIGTLLDDGAVG